MRALMLFAHDLGMINGDYAFLTVNLLPSAAIGNNTFMGNDGRDAEAAVAFRGILSIYVREPTTELWRSFKKEVKEKMKANPFQIHLDDSEQVFNMLRFFSTCSPYSNYSLLCLYSMLQKATIILQSHHFYALLCLHKRL